jgi:murein DD-endopeptidase MepM/ murein hydrolase activator NlpD
MRRIVLVVLAVLWAGLAQAEPLRLDGKATIGGLMLGKTEAGATVEQDGAPVRVARDGSFVIGFGYDSGPESVVTVSLPDGRRVVREIVVTPREFAVQRIDGLPKRMVTPDAEALRRIRADQAAVAAARAQDTDVPWFRDGFDWPAKGRISGVYGSRRILNGQPRQPHYGIDIAAPRGSPVVSPAPGRVVLAHPDMYFTGKTLIIDHGHGLSSAMLHLDSLAVKEGDQVARGQPVGTVGSTGRSTGPHLDWRVNLFGKRLDPALLAGEMPR